MERHKSCCFIGHRKIINEADLTSKLSELIDKLIFDGVNVFIFGSKSEFNDLCYKIVNSKRVEFPFIKRVLFTCANEACVFEREKEELSQSASAIIGKSVEIFGFDEERRFAARERAGKASYLQRNRAMIDDSDVCVFYYKLGCDFSKSDKTDIYEHKASGAKAAYEYAAKKNKRIYNVFG